MIRISKITGLTAVADGTGRRLGTVERVALSADGLDAHGLVLRMRGWLRRKRFVPLGCIALWGEVTVAASGVQLLPQAVSGRRDVIGMSVLDTSGERLGWVTDALIDEKTGSVSALEVSAGFWEDFAGGRFCVADFTMRPDGVVAVTEHTGAEDDAPVCSR